MLPKENRLRKKKDIEQVFKHGRYSAKNLVALKLKENGFALSRFAFVISTKVAKKATVRNKIRRQLREIVRLKLESIKPGFDVVVMPRKETLQKSYKEIEKDLTKVLEDVGLLCEKYDQANEVLASGTKGF